MRAPTSPGGGSDAASKSSSSTSTSATIATAASTLPAISVKAWWEMYLTSGARGLIGGSETP